MSGFRLNHIGIGKLSVGILLVFMSLLMPLAVNTENFTIYETLTEAIRQQENIYIIFAALKLVALNSLRSIPHYLGAFFIGEAVEFFHNEKRLTVLRPVIICVIIPSVYFLIGELYNIHYDFGGPALLLIAMLIMLGKADFSMVNLSKKALMVVTLITAVQFLDVMPSFKGLPVGRGETSGDIKRYAAFLGADTFLQFSAVLLFGLLLFSSILLCKLIMDENHLKVLNEINAKNERMRSEQRIRILGERTHMELKHLVHDLKTPLTSAQALVGVVKMGCERDKQAQNIEYLSRAEASMEHMSAMISEILYEDNRSIVTIGEIMTALLAQTSNASYAGILKTANDIPMLNVEVNKIRFLRAVINLIENAFFALPPDGGEICLKAEAEQIDGQRYARLSIVDNGKGISPDSLREIWEDGYSTRGSHGLGLSFVKQVIAANDGTIEITSLLGKGTTVTIHIPESGEEK